MSHTFASIRALLLTGVFVWAVTLTYSQLQAEGDMSTQEPSVEPAQVLTTLPEMPGATKAKPQKEGTSAAAPHVQWIWGPGGASRYVFRKRFDGGSKAATLLATCDNSMEVFINGNRVAASSAWEQPVKIDVQKHIRDGENILLVQAANAGGVAGLAAKLDLEMPDGSRRYVVTDKTWQAAADQQSDQWKPVKTMGRMGSQPWGNVFAGAGRAGDAARDVFNVLPGFQVELLYTVPKNSHGSWVSIAFDHKGRLIASDQGKQGLFRITPPPIGSDQETRVEKLDVDMTAAQGMVYAFDSLYVSVNGGPGSGLYRLRDTNGDDQYDDVQKLRALAGGGEHGPHAVRLSPDGRSLYVIAGNHTNLPDDITASRVPREWSEDHLLPRQWDARGHARGRLAPGGWICKTDPEGKTWEVVSIGYRNSYDMAFNADGELFAYDADMEWDMGTPWYRPTRLTHATSGSEFGWRSGTGKWPTYYVDSLPPAINTGPGSPVGVTFGYGAKFPAKYQRALYLLDWTFGTIYAIHLKPQGASYSATKEEFLSRTPLPLTDAEVGPDGALYFTIGGRGTQSALYRVTYIGDEATDPVEARDRTGAEARATRRLLEDLHALDAQGGAAHEEIWPYLSHADRFIRYAARVALEHQDVNGWQQKALSEADPQSLITAAVALARQGDKSLQADLLAALDRIDHAQLSETQQLELLRAYALTFIRMGQPDRATASRIAKRLDAHYPAKNDDLNRELCRVLVYLNSPTVITETLALMQQPSTAGAEELAELIARNPRYGNAIRAMLDNQPEIQNVHYALALRNMRFGWTLDQRKQYFDWLNAAAQRSGGASYRGFIDNIRKEALATLSEAEKKSLDAKVLAPPPKLDELPKPKGPGREWTKAEVLTYAAGQLKQRDFANGQRTFAAARCVSCHRFNGDGSATGPDLSNVAGRFSPQDLIEAITEPSKVISDQYLGSIIETADGKVITGRILSEADDEVTVLTDPFDATKVATLKRADIESTEPSQVSEMPKGLLEPLNEQELLDLLAYLLSRGDAADPMFAN